jgi:hypothetical protein
MDRAAQITSVRGRGCKWLVGLILACGVLLGGCYGGPDADHFVAIVDELAVPAGWRVLETVVRGPEEDGSCDPMFSNECPAAIRSFVVDADTSQAFDEAKDVVGAAGFAITDEGTAGCATGSSTGPPCGFFAERAGDLIYVGIYHSPVEAGLEPQVGEGAAVVVRAFASE